MNKDNIYTQWTHQRRQVSVPEDFARGVMEKIQNQRPGAGFHLFDRLDPQPHLLGRWAAALGLIALGLYRLFFVTANLLMGSAL